MEDNDLKLGQKQKLIWLEIYSEEEKESPQYKSSKISPKPRAQLVAHTEISVCQIKQVIISGREHPLVEAAHKDRINTN